MKHVAGTETPISAQRNSAGSVCIAIAKDKGLKQNLTLEISKGVPIGVGLGSSGASAAAAAVAMDEFFGLGMSKDELIFYAGKGEQAASGTAHYDNVSASVLGGFVMVAGGVRPSAIRFDPPKRMGLCVVTPVVKLPERKTEYARSLLPKAVPLGVMVSTVAKASMIVSGFARGDVDLVGKGMNGSIVDASRKKMIPSCDAVMRAAEEAGGSGSCISGAGPSILSLVDADRAKAEDVLSVMVSEFERNGVRADGFVSKVGDGAKRIEGR